MSRAAPLEGSGSKVVAVVPLYAPPESAAHGIRRLAAQVDVVVLVDDGSPTDVSAFVASIGVPGVRLVRSLENLGIAHALNLGVAEAVHEDADWVLTADQDSVFQDDYVEEALAAAAALRSDRIEFACIAAGVVDGKPNPSRPHPGTVLRTTAETIQSGMLFPSSVLQTLGPFDESLFIDCVDTDYILRGTSRGLPTFLGPECRMEHALGEGIEVRLPAVFRRRSRVVPYHPPLRRYYITRNRVRLLLRHGASNPRWAIVQTGEQVKSIVADLVWGPDRGGAVVAGVRGALDGLRAKEGRIPTKLEFALRRGSRGRVRQPRSMRMV